MPGRDDFPKRIFEDNPFDGLHPEQVYEKLRWGNESEQAWEFDAPEPMASLGRLARLDVHEGGKRNPHEQRFDDEAAPFVGVGTVSNRLYLIPAAEDGGPIDVPEGAYELRGNVSRVDYISQKGDEDAYYYHEHETPHPELYECRTERGTVYIIEPVEHDGARSYAVDEEGIIG